MTIDRQYGDLVFECDTCDDVFHSEHHDYGFAWAAAKVAGWKARQLNSGWGHACPECAKGFTALIRSITKLETL